MASETTGTPAPALTLRLKVRQFDDVAEALGWPGDVAAARAIGVDRATVWRVRQGAAPGPRFVAGLLAAAAPWTFDHFFRVVPEGSK